MGLVFRVRAFEPRPRLVPPLICEASVLLFLDRKYQRKRNVLNLFFFYNRDTSSFFSRNKNSLIHLNFFCRTKFFLEIKKTFVSQFFCFWMMWSDIFLKKIRFLDIFFWFLLRNLFPSNSFRVSKRWSRIEKEKCQVIDGERKRGCWRGDFWSNDNSILDSLLRKIVKPWVGLHFFFLQYCSHQYWMGSNDY